MPQYKQVILFNNSGLDSDTSNRFKVPGNSDMILNDIISFIEGEAGARVNAKGNELVYDAGTGYTFVGQVIDIERRSVIWLLHHNAGNHSIVSINVETDQVTPILTNQTVLNFPSNKLITHIDVVGDLLLWTDGSNEPRKINIPKAIEFSAEIIPGLMLDDNLDVFTDDDDQRFLI